MSGGGSTGRVILHRLRQLLFGRPMPHPDDAAPPLPPGRLVDIGERGQVFVRDQDGPSDAVPVLLLHGWFASAELNWFGAFAPFAAERRVIAIDHRGHGRGIRPIDGFRLVDCADDAAALLDALGISRAIVVGFSMGGPIGLHLTRRRPELVAGLVTASTAAVFSTTGVERWRWRMIRLLEIGLRLGLGDRLVARIAADWGRVDDRFAPYGGWLVAEFTRASPRSMREAGRELAHFDARPWLHEIDVPAAAVVTSKDSLVPPRRQEALASALGATVTRLAGADHDIPTSGVDRFGAAIHGAVADVGSRIDAVTPSSAADAG